MGRERNDDRVSNREPTASLCIRPIDDRTRPDEIKTEFRKFGAIKDVRIPVDFHTRAPRGFAYVDYLDVDSAVKARESLDGKEFNGQHIQVYYSQGVKKSPGEMVRQKEAQMLKMELEEMKGEADNLGRRNRSSSEKSKDDRPRDRNSHADQTRSTSTTASSRPPSTKRDSSSTTDKRRQNRDRSRSPNRSRSSHKSSSSRRHDRR